MTKLPISLIMAKPFILSTQTGRDATVATASALQAGINPLINVNSLNPNKTERKSRHRTSNKANPDHTTAICITLCIHVPLQPHE
jgi:hypothetical protein